MKRAGLLVAFAWIVVFVGNAAAADIGGLSAKAAMVVDRLSGEVLFAREPDRRLPPASTTKILTAHLAVRSGKLDESFRVSRHASSMEPTKIWLQPGWRVRAEDLVYAILLNSANDASVVLAEGLAGTVHDFGREMTREAHRMGATQSRFVNPNGLPARGHYSTARDLITIMRHALTSPFLREVLSTKTRSIRTLSPSSRRIRLRSKNRLLDGDDYHVIGKTGYTRAARRCFVGAATDGQREILVSMLGSDHLWGDVRRLIEHGFAKAELPVPRYYPSEEDWQQAAAQAARPDADPEQAARAVFHVRLASFHTRAHADAFRRRIHEMGYEPVIERLLANQRPLYRVTLRGFYSRRDADDVAERLSQTYRIEPLVVSVGA